MNNIYLINKMDEDNKNFSKEILDFEASTQNKNLENIYNRENSDKANTKKKRQLKPMKILIKPNLDFVENDHNFAAVQTPNQHLQNTPRQNKNYINSEIDLNINNKLSIQFNTPKANDKQKKLVKSKFINSNSNKEEIFHEINSSQLGLVAEEESVHLFPLQEIQKKKRRYSVELNKDHLVKYEQEKLILKLEKNKIKNLRRFSTDILLRLGENDETNKNQFRLEQDIDNKNSKNS